MSHFTEIKTNLTNTQILKKALKKMGFTVVEEENGVDVRGFFDETEKAEFKVLTETHYDIGFVKTEDGSYEVVGDWNLLPKVSKIGKEQFLKDLKREYAQEGIMQVAEEKGYDVTCVEDEETQNIELVVTQW